MKAPLFEYPSYQYQIDDWDFKKKVPAQKNKFTKLHSYKSANF